MKTARLCVAHLRDAFNGQSVALTSWLIRNSTPAEFADFMEESQRSGIDLALKEHYQLNGGVELQHEWNE